MKILKYLKLFEAFESETVSKILKYINKESGNESSDKFLETLRQLFLDKYNLPLSKISDSDVRYLSSKKAFEIKKEGDISNPYGIYALKFWFSLKKGYLGVTAVGDTEEFVGQFSKYEFEHLKEQGLETGILTPVTFYSELKHGDTVAGVFSSDYDSISSLSKARIFIDGEVLFAIQNVSDGGTPNDRSYRDWGRYSWSLGGSSSPESDHHKLHKWTPSDEPLRVSNSEFTESFLDWMGRITNSPIQRWININDLKDADFAIVIYFDGLLKDEKVSDIRSLRTKEKEGATKLISDEQFKKMNFQRYFNRIMEMYGLTLNTDESDLKNLQNMVRSLLAGDMICFSFYSGEPPIVIIERIIGDIRNLTTSEDKKYYLDLLSNRYKDGRHVSDSFIKIYNGSFNRVKNNADEKTIKFFNKLQEISKEINNGIKLSKVESIGDLMILKRKIVSIREFFMDIKDEYFSKGISRAIENFKYNDSDVDRGVELANLESNLDKEMKGLNIFEKFVKQILN